MSNYTLKVNVDSTQQTALQKNKYNLCLAKMVNGVYTVVFQGGKFLAKNTFKWTEKYQTYGVSTFEDSMLVEAATNAVGIDFGQTAILDKQGVMQAAKGPKTGNSFKVQNDYGAIHMGVNLLFSGNYVPIYVGENETVAGVEELTPVVKILVWFDRVLKTGTMFSHSISYSYEVDLTNSNSAEIAYVTDPDGKGVWVDGSGNAMLPSTYSAKAGFDIMSMDFAVGDVERLLAKAGTLALEDRKGDAINAANADESREDARDSGIVKVVLTYEKEKMARDSAAFLSNIIIPNLNLTGHKVVENKAIFEIGWSHFTFMKEIMKGEGDFEKIKNAFNAELDVVKDSPTDKKWVMVG